MSKIIRLDENDLTRIIKHIVNEAVNEYRDRKSYQKSDDAGFIERMNQFCEKYGYEPFHYGRKQGLDPEMYAKQIITAYTKNPPASPISSFFLLTVTGVIATAGAAATSSISSSSNLAREASFSAEPVSLSSSSSLSLSSHIT